MVLIPDGFSSDPKRVLGSFTSPIPRSSESFKPGFVPPWDLSKHSPLIKSQSLISIRRVRSREDGTDAEPTPVPVPSPRSSRERRNVQRTQSVPAQNKAARRLRKQSSVEHVVETTGGDGARSCAHREGTVSPPGVLGSVEGCQPIGLHECRDLLGVMGWQGASGGGWDHGDALVRIGSWRSFGVRPWGSFGGGWGHGDLFVEDRSTVSF